MTAKTGVIYLLKDKFQFYSPYAGRVVEVRFTPEMTRDLDVINSELLENTIKLFVTNSKMSPFNLVIVLSENTYFVKDFLMPQHQKPSANSQPEITLEVLQKQAIEFIEHVPFDNVVSKTIPLKDGMRVCATNKDFYEAIVVSFENLGFTVESVIPGLVLGNGLSLRPVMDQTMASMILQKVNSAREYNLLGQKVFQPQTKQETEEVDEIDTDRTQTKKSERKKIYALGGVFFSLVVVLIIVYVQSQTPPTRPRQPALAANPTAPPAAPTVQVVATPTPVAGGVDVTPSAADTQNLTVQIVNVSVAPSDAQSLLDQLDTYKFKSVNLEAQNSVQTSQTLISFSPATGQAVRNTVLTEVKKIVSNVSVQEKQLSTADITIVLAK
jgi:hypothetical protein